jgi:hypothetical protein
MKRRGIGEHRGPSGVLHFWGTLGEIIQTENLPSTSRDSDPFDRMRFARLATSELGFE